MVWEAHGKVELVIEYCERAIAWMDAQFEHLDQESREPFRQDIERLWGSSDGAGG